MASGHYRSRSLQPNIRETPAPAVVYDWRPSNAKIGCAINLCNRNRGLMTEITTVGVDLAKDVIVVRAGDRMGQPIYTRQLSFRGFAL